MLADGISHPGRRAVADMIKRDNKAGEGGFKRQYTFGRENVAPSRRASASCDDIEHSARRLNSVPGGDDTELGRGRAIASDADTKDFGAVQHIGGEAHVGRKAVEAECAAAIDDN